MRAISLCLTATAGCISTVGTPPPPCEPREVSDELDFSADDVLDAASVSFTDTARAVDTAFVAGAAEAWALPVAVQLTFALDGEPTVVEYDPPPSGGRECPIGPTLRVPVSLHATGTLGDGAFGYRLKREGRYSLVASAPSTDAMSIEHDATGADDWGTTTVDAAVQSALLADTRLGGQCRGSAEISVAGFPTSRFPGSVEKDVSRGGIGITCPDTSWGYVLQWGEWLE